MALIPLRFRTLLLLLQHLTTSECYANYSVWKGVSHLAELHRPWNYPTAAILLQALFPPTKPGRKITATLSVADFRSLSIVSIFLCHRLLAQWSIPIRLSNCPINFFGLFARNVELTFFFATDLSMNVRQGRLLRVETYSCKRESSRQHVAVIRQWSVRSSEKATR